ncbi:hypothetical protein CPB84DRAFT_1832863 [Gymnopilus junonius]|uniref:Uncharacterized protein n=1 Tax=Gymnopilus junonius TaxID=109634 RepID=A0A9P5P3C1_GYMJU|nr:hypothetical protein CPB84DRAFT_1832863 [Gymnopilus junonius]
MEVMIEDEWTNLLHDHPIFSVPKSHESILSKDRNILELSTNTVSNFTNLEPEDDSLAPSGRRQIMILKDADIIVAAGTEIRMSSIGDLKLSRTVRKSYKTLHTPNIQFEIHQISLNPSGNLLAVAGAYQVAVIVLPRSGYGRLISDSIDCRAAHVGQFYHAANNSAPIAKIDWHPWGKKLREYHTSIDTEEPQQILTFVPERKAKSFIAEDSSEREVASFTIGKGNADWGPLTVYAVMKSGDIFSICPYIPQNALSRHPMFTLWNVLFSEQEFLAQETSPNSKLLSAIYDYQHKYSIPMHPPTTIKAPPLRQGPFLLQPSPRLLEGSEGGDATDITYLSFGTDDSADDTKDPEHLGVVLVAYQDGKKVEARWNIKNEDASSHDLPVLATYETIDLGVVEMLAQVIVHGKSGALLDLIPGSHPVFLPDPLHDDMVYVYHAFGVHALDISPVLQHLTASLREENEDESLLKENLEEDATTSVMPILNTFSAGRRCSNPVVAVAIPNNVYLTYSIFILTSVMRMISFPLHIRSQPSDTKKPPVVDAGPDATNKSKWLTPLEGPIKYVSSLGKEPYNPPIVTTRFPGLLNDPKSSLSSSSKQFMLTPETLRFIGKAVGDIGSQIQEIHVAYQVAIARLAAQRQELGHQLAKCKDMQSRIEKLKGPDRQASEGRLANIQEEQKTLLARFDRLLQALMKEASPELSEYETKWFGELKRMKQEVEKEYSRILPSLRSLAEKEGQMGKKTAESNQSLGFSQAFEYGQRSNLDRTRIRDVEKEITKLAARLDLSLGQPPMP